METRQDHVRKHEVWKILEETNNLLVEIGFDEIEQLQKRHSIKNQILAKGSKDATHGGGHGY